MGCRWTSAALLLLLAGLTPLAWGQSLDDLQEQAMKAAVQKVAPSVVQIETSGGTDIIGMGQGGGIRRGVGPTTGLVVAAEGYVISSAFNFANRPSAVFVAVPGHKERYVAKTIATDHTRMLTLLKIDATGLPVPEAAPKKEMRVGQWALALGRTWTTLDNAPSVSAGIISALGRIWGKAIQTDAKVSPVNYGGPLIDLRGRVLGVIVPASPRGQDETAGVEWYDSGIGFAIPLEDINAVLPRLRKGENLKRGLLGVTLEGSDWYAQAPTISGVSPESAAGKAGLKPGDVILEINGTPVTRQAQMMHLLGEKYEGDTVAVKVRRGKEEIAIPSLKLTGEVSAYTHPFLGILPIRDDPEPGEEVRYVFPGSPAAATGIKAGDRVMKLGLGEAPLQPFAGRDQLTAVLNRLPAGTRLKVEVQRKEGKKAETLTLTLGVLSDTVPAELPERSTAKRALEAPQRVAAPMAPGRADPKGKLDELKKDAEKEKAPPRPAKKDVETGFLQRTNAAGDRTYWLYVPDNYDANVSHALVLWLHPAGKGDEQDMKALAEAWETICEEKHFILVCPQAENMAGWLASETEAVEQIAREVMDQYTVDAQRVVAHGMGIGGQMAFYLGLNARDLVRGVATVGAALGSQPRDNVAAQRLAFFLVAGGKDPLAPAIQETMTTLRERRFPVAFRELPDQGHQYLDADTLDELVRWIDALDRQ